uniref:Uncharacterized protein n=1 Tax=Anguilla anguilla TaxID=7936 RepID=A0A0E9PAX9_ANGAN
MRLKKDMVELWLYCIPFLKILIIPNKLIDKSSTYIY